MTSVTSPRDLTNNPKHSTTDPNTVEQSAGPVNPQEECRSDAEVIMQDVESAETESSDKKVTQKNVESCKEHKDKRKKISEKKKESKDIRKAATVEGGNTRKQINTGIRNLRTQSC